MQNSLLHEILAAVLVFLQALIPPALGALVSVLFKKGLSWGERLIQIFIGVCVSWFVTGALRSVWDFSDFMAQAVGFVLAMIAFEATPPFIRSAGAAIGKLPDAVGGWIQRKFGGGA